MEQKHNPYHSVPGKRGVLLVNLGTPESATPWSVAKYLSKFLSDPRVVNLPRILWLPILFGVIVPFRSRASAKKYQRIFDEHGSPLYYHTQRLADKLQNTMPNVVVKMAMCYSAPSVEKAMEQMRSQGVMHLKVLPLYPQYSATTVGAVFDQVCHVLKKWRYLPTMTLISQYVHVPAYINAMAKQVERYWKINGQPQRLLLSYHGIPVKQFEAGDPYSCFCQKTTRLLSEVLQDYGVDIVHVYQSQFGPSQWLEPSCEGVLKQCVQEGVDHVDVFCPGFAVDCLETIDEIAHEYAELFENAGGRKLRYIPALNGEDEHVDVLNTVLSAH